MSFTMSLRNRLDLLSHIGPSIEYTFGTYEAPFAEGRVIGPDGQPVLEVPSEVRRAQARVMLEVRAFEAVAARELSALEGGAR
jgi:hypothetical protein